MVRRMASRTARQRAPKRLAPARMDPEDYDAMTRLAGKHERSVGGEYRAAVKAWLAQHSENGGAQ